MRGMQDPALYASANALQRRDAAVVLAAALPAMTWQAGERVLDVGSGSGEVTATLLVPAIPVPATITGAGNIATNIEIACKLKI